MQTGSRMSLHAYCQPLAAARCVTQRRVARAALQRRAARALRQRSAHRALDASSRARRAARRRTGSPPRPRTASRARPPAAARWSPPRRKPPRRRARAAVWARCWRPRRRARGSRRPYHALPDPSAQSKGLRTIERACCRRRAGVWRHAQLLPRVTRRHRVRLRRPRRGRGAQARLEQRQTLLVSVLEARGLQPRKGASAVPRAGSCGSCGEIPCRGAHALLCDLFGQMPARDWPVGTGGGPAASADPPRRPPLRVRRARAVARSKPRPRAGPTARRMRAAGMVVA